MTILLSVEEASGLVMGGLSKTEVNLRRLLAAAPQQQNQAKLMHYVATMREQLEQLMGGATSEALPSISKAKVNDYAEKIESLASKLASLVNDLSGSLEPVDGIQSGEEPSRKNEASSQASLPGLRKRLGPRIKPEERTRAITPGDSSRAVDITPGDSSRAVKLDVAAQAHIEKHRKLQEDLTDEMVVLAQQLKESSLVMNQSLQDTQKILDSTERAVEHSLASTGHANERAMEVYSKTFKTTCFTWLMIFVMTCVFVMVVLLIRVT